MGVASTTRSVVDVVRDRNVTFLAASVAYYAFVSLIPLALLIIVVGSILLGQAFADIVVNQFTSALSSSGQQVLRRALTNSAGRTGAGVVGVAALIWSALRLFRGLDVAFSEIYGSAGEPSLVEQLIDGAVTVALVVLAAGLVVALGYAVRSPAVAQTVPYVNVVGRIALLVGLTVAFLPLYYVLPPVDVTVREALPGAAFAAVGWLVLQALFQLYTANASKYQAYGVIGALLLFVTWLYFAGVVVLVGAVINAVRAGNGYQRVTM
ncbi:MULTISPECIES: YihY/virulence factor BrkB family protein [Halorussus]|uniref:YihY/virulence factor BrkB family protein n=1 Tax=Halorussus TaxID=1070314 RepID=UPI00209F6FCD|nr:YihY/virulence factor BrkB family protein [Halorussus vallis]USZ76666.1 YihY/virulence factor BrkB family protein [Halorussus vallis]